MMSGEQNIWVSGILKKFDCVGSHCADTCCHGWAMQVDAHHADLYAKDANLRDSVETGATGLNMKRRCDNQACVELDNGLCGIQNEHGAEMMPDSCHFFPRIPRKVAGNITMGTALSCPEITRLVLYSDEPLSLEKSALIRLPVKLKDYRPEGLEGEQARAITQVLLGMVEDGKQAPEVAMGAIARLGRALSLSSPSLMPTSILPLADLVKRVKAPPEIHPGDLQRLLQVTAGLIHSAKNRRHRLDQVMNLMASGLSVSLDWNTLNLFGGADAELAPARLMSNWAQHGWVLRRPMKRWIQAQILSTGYPFAGPGQDLLESTWLLCLRFAILRLALISYVDKVGTKVDPETVIGITQTLSRALDHTDAPELAISLFRQMGWERPGRLRALLGDLETQPVQSQVDPTRRIRPNLPLEGERALAESKGNVAELES